MRTDRRIQGIPDVTDQTLLDDPVRVKWRAKTRSQIHGRAEAALAADREVALAIRCFTRLKGEIVIKTEEEAAALNDLLDAVNEPSEWDEPCYAHAHESIRRVQEAIADAFPELVDDVGVVSEHPTP